MNEVVKRAARPWRLLVAGRSRLACAALLLVAFGCEEDDPPDSWSIDASPKPLDAAVDAALDAGLDAAADASGEERDGGAGPIGSECLIEGEVLNVGIHEPRERAWSAVSDGHTVHLVYTVPTCTVESRVNGSRLEYRTFASRGPFSEPTVLTNDSDGVCRTQRSPALALEADGQPALYYATSREGGFELYRTNPSAPTLLVRMTEDAQEASDIELHTAATLFGDAPLFAYVNQRSAVASPGQLVTRRSGQPENEIVSAMAGQAPSRIALLAFPNPAGGGLVAWVSEQAGAPTLRVQALHPEGGANGAPVELTTAVGGLSGIALAPIADRAVAVYTVQSGSSAQLRYVSLDRSGRPTASPTELTTIDRSVSSPSLAPLSTGFVVAFREVFADTSLPASLRMQFVVGGRAVAERRLGDAAPAGGATQVLVMNDGRLVVLWSDATGSGTTLRAVRARCL